MLVGVDNLSTKWRLVISFEKLLLKIFSFLNSDFDILGFPINFRSFKTSILGTNDSISYIWSGCWRIMFSLSDLESAATKTAAWAKFAVSARIFVVKDLFFETAWSWLFERDKGGLLIGEGLNLLGLDSARVSRIFLL